MSGKPKAQKKLELEDFLTQYRGSTKIPLGRQSITEKLSFPVNTTLPLTAGKDCSEKPQFGPYLPSPVLLAAGRFTNVRTTVVKRSFTCFT